jgi:hypothetical protein
VRRALRQIATLRAVRARLTLAKRVTLLTSPLARQRAPFLAKSVGAARVRITTVLLRRKQRRYKKLIARFLKARRLR